MDLINICASYITANEEFLFIAFVCLTFVTLIRILTTTPVVPTLASETQLLLKLNMECNLLKEYNLLKEGQYHDPEIHASPIDVNNTANNMLLWKAVIVGPQDTPYKNGIFNLVIEFSTNYPCASRVVFISKMFHPNVCDTGPEMLLTKTSDSDPEHTSWSNLPWSNLKIKHGEVLLGNDMWRGYEVYFILKTIQTLLGYPDVVDQTAILNSEAAKLFNENYEEYENRVLECVEESLLEDKASDIQKYLDQAQTEDDDRTWQVLEL